MAYAIDIADSDSVNLGSNPSPPAIQFKPPLLSLLAPARRLVQTPVRSRRHTGRRTAQAAYSPCARLNSSSAA
jgi:hypothetical protein